MQSKRRPSAEVHNAVIEVELDKKPMVPPAELVQRLSKTRSESSTGKLSIAQAKREQLLAAKSRRNAAAVDHARAVSVKVREQTRNKASALMQSLQTKSNAAAVCRAQHLQVITRIARVYSDRVRLAADSRSATMKAAVARASARRLMKQANSTFAFKLMALARERKAALRENRVAAAEDRREKIAAAAVERAMLECQRQNSSVERREAALHQVYMKAARHRLKLSWAALSRNAEIRAGTERAEQLKMRCEFAEVRHLNAMEQKKPLSPSLDRKLAAPFKAEEL